jgi:hypothetical protein
MPSSAEPRQRLPPNSWTSPPLGGELVHDEPGFVVSEVRRISTTERLVVGHLA